MGTGSFNVRLLFRIFELSSRFLIYILIWLLYGIIGVIVIIGIHFCHMYNLFLFFGGCLGREVFNIIAFIFYIPKLNKTLQQGKQIQCLTNNFYCQFQST